MELARERSFTEGMQSKLLDCKQACTGLQNNLSALNERWQPKGLLLEEREDEVRGIHEALKECIEDQHYVAHDRDMIDYEIQTLEDRCAQMEMHNKRSEEQIKEYTATIEEIKKHNEKMVFTIHLAGQKKLREMNSGMMLQLSEREQTPGS